MEEGHACVRACVCARGGGAAAFPTALTGSPGSVQVSVIPRAGRARPWLQAPAANHPHLIRSLPPGPGPGAHPPSSSRLSPSLRTRAPAASDLVSEPPGEAGGAAPSGRGGGPGAPAAGAGPGARALRPAPRGEGCDWSRRPRPGGRRGCRTCAARPPRAPSCAHWGPGAPAGARPLSARPFGCKRPGGRCPTPRGGQRGPRNLLHHSLANAVQQW